MGEKNQEMVILGFDTSTAMLSVGLKNNTRIAEVNILADRKHQELLFGQIQKLLKETQTKIKDLQAVACGLGPGSFIGSRIGVVAAKTIAQVNNIPLIGIPTLDIIAASANIEEILVATDAKRGEIFYSFYKWNVRLGDINVAKPGKLSILLRGKSITITGSALGKYPEIFSNYNKTSEDLWYPKGKNIIEIAAEKYRLKQFEDCYSLVPIYVREVDARECFIECKR